jgi:MFS transporter, FHS family, L-fucose permease
MNQQKTKSGYWLPLIIVGLLFFILGFALGINTYLIPFLREGLKLSTAASYLVMAATFSAFVVFGIPSGYILQSTGYKKGISLSFIIMAIGMILFVPSAKMTSFVLFLLALFIGGMGQTLLQAAVNPYVVILGPNESAARRISLMGIFNKVAVALAPVVLSIFMNLQNINIDDVIRPFYIISAILIVCAGISYLSPLPELEDPGSSSGTFEETEKPKGSIFRFSYLFLGLAALFMDVGVEIISLGTVLDYSYSLDLKDFMLGGIDLLAPEIFVSYATLSMITGYILGIILIPKYLSQPDALKLSTILGLILTILVLVLPPLGSVFMVAVLGLANAFLWPAIWPLSIGGLGEYTKRGSSILVIGIVGGAVIPLTFGWLVDLISYQWAYIVCIPCYLYILFFAVKGHKIGKAVVPL